VLKPATEAAYDLLHRGTLALANVERNGIRIDVEYLDKTIAKVGRQIQKMEMKLQADKVWRLWTRRFGRNAGFAKQQQLATIVFEELGHEVLHRTDKGQPSTDEAAFEHINEPFVRRYFKWKKLQKIQGTYLSGIRREVCNGFLYNFFHLHLVKTFRSSSSLINFQNIPIRDPKAGKLIRRCFIPRSPDRVLVEIDFSGIEVRIAACYNRDPVLISYIQDKTKDMHRDMAAQCYKMKPEQVDKMSRYCAKNMFVFPEFYGSIAQQCAPNLWAACTKHKLTVGETPMLEWLKQHGIKSLGNTDFKSKTPLRPGTFVKHIKDVEEDFWNNRFQVYSKWKRSWYDRYLRNGGFHTLTGFTEDSYLKRNDVINHPVQGSAFHCLLWSLTEINDYLVKSRKRSKLVGQIHDSILADVHLDELDDYLKMAHWVMTEALLKHWKWIIVPVEVEMEVTPPGGSWYEKKAVELAA